MKPKWIALGMTVFMVAALLGAQRQDPEHPWPDHEPPADYRCVPARNANAVKTDIHACSCLGMTLDPMCSTKDENDARQDSNRCKSWCKKSQCTCHAQCDKDTN